MAKSYNPADAFRKAQRAKELKKNKDARKKVREVQVVKRDTRELEGEIRSLQGKSDNASKSRIAELESELAYVKKTKEAYVKEHPDAADQVFKPRGSGNRAGDAEGEEEKAALKERLYDESGRLRDPTRSAYYDPVYNPWGVPPPGMAYKEKDGLDNDDADSDEEEESDEEIVMPEGPPPADTAGSDEENDSDDDIPLPTGPPPPKAAPSIPAGPSGWGGRAPPVPIPFHQPIHMGGPGMPPPPMGMSMPYPPLQQMNPSFHPHAHAPHGGPGQAGPSRHFRPPRQAPAMVQDPLSDEPQQTYQGYHASLPARPPSDGTISAAPTSLPVRLASSASSSTGTAATAAAGAIEAAPVLRDLRKETTVFVPRNLKRKAPPGGVGGRINAAPGAGVRDEEGDAVVQRPQESGLMGRLKDYLGPEVGNKAGQNKAGKGAADEDYERFLAGLGDLT